MEKIVKLCEWLHNEGVFIMEAELPLQNKDTKSLSIKLNDSGTWGIFFDPARLQTTSEAKVAVLHECGHYCTGSTHAVSSPFDLVEKHEYSADKWAVRNGISEEELDVAVAEGYTEIWELAEYFNVTEEFMRKAVCWYTHGNLATELYL